MSNAVIAATLLAVAFFPTNGGFQSLAADIAFLAVLPVVFIRFFLKEKLSVFGVSWGDMGKGIAWSGALLVSAGIVFVGIIRFTDLAAHVLLPLSIRTSFLLFLIYILLAGIYVALYAFFFCGFMLSVWRRLGYRAIVVQSFLATMLLVVRSDWRASADAAAVFAFALCSGWIAFRSRSVWYPFFFFFISVILGISMVLVSVK